jgi:hypothetical protein
MGVPEARNARSMSKSQTEKATVTEIAAVMQESWLDRQAIDPNIRQHYARRDAQC